MVLFGYMYYTAGFVVFYPKIVWVFIIYTIIQFICIFIQYCISLDNSLDDGNKDEYSLATTIVNLIFIFIYGCFLDAITKRYSIEEESRRNERYVGFNEP